MASGFRGKPGEGSIDAAPLKKSLLWIVVGGIAVVLLIVLAVHMKQRRLENPSGSAFELKVPAPRVQATQGDFTLTSTNEWQGVSSFDPTKRIVGKMLTPNVWRQVRLDTDDARIYTLPPSNLSTGHVEFPEFNTIEWRLRPGDAVTQALQAWEKVARR